MIPSPPFPLPCKCRAKFTTMFCPHELAPVLLPGEYVEIQRRQDVTRWLVAYPCGNGCMGVGVVSELGRCEAVTRGHPDPLGMSIAKALTQLRSKHEAQ